MSAAPRESSAGGGSRGSSAAGGGVSSAAEGGVPRPRARRPRGIRESLLSIVLGLEAAVVFFATLTAFGLRALDPVLAFAGGGVLFVVLVLAAGVQRWTWGTVLGGVLQVALTLTGILVPMMWVVGGGFALFWVWCLVRALQIERQQAAAAAEGDRA